jgi:hypothetical protein
VLSMAITATMDVIKALEDVCTMANNRPIASEESAYLTKNIRILF